MLLQTLSRPKDVQEVHVTAEADQYEVKFDPVVLFAAEYLQATETEVFEQIVEVLLIFSRHVKQHGSAGIRVSVACYIFIFVLLVEFC